MPAASRAFGFLISLGAPLPRAPTPARRPSGQGAAVEVIGKRRQRQAGCGEIQSAIALALP